MTVEIHQPREELRSRVESFLAVRSEEGLVRTLSPNTAPVLVFRFQGVVAEQLPDGERVLPAMALTGLNSSPRVIHYHRGSALIVVRLREGGLTDLVSTPMDELSGASSGLDSIMDPSVVREMEDRLGKAPDDAARIAVIQDFLLSGPRGRPLDPLVAESIRRIRRSRGNVGMRDLVHELATNADTLEKRFRHALGATPKMFSRIVRFQSFVNGYKKQADLTEAALQAGFYDQAHLVKEFRSFTGQSPTAFLLRQPAW